MAKYEETSTTALTADPAVVVPLLTINNWILMQRKVRLALSSVSFNQNWAAYRDGFGSVTGNDNYWLGLDKVYRLMQLGRVRLRVEVCKLENCHNNIAKLLSNVVLQIKLYNTCSVTIIYRKHQTAKQGRSRVASEYLTTTLTIVFSFFCKKTETNHWSCS